MTQTVVVPTARVCNFAGLGWDLELCISGKFPGATAGAGLETILREQLVYAKRGS